MKTVIVTPTYQEAQNIEEFLRRVRESVADADILIIDDGSPDGTADLVEEFGKTNGRAQVIRRPKKSGLGSAYRDGFRWALDQGYDFVVQMDADLSHDPAALPHLLAAAKTGVDMVIGSRYVPGGEIPRWPLRRRLLSRWGNRYAGWVTGMGVRDATSGFRVFSSSALNSMPFGSLHADGYGFQIEVAYEIVRSGGNIVEYPIRFIDRTRGESKMSSFIVAEALVLVTWWGLRDRVFAKLRTRK